MAKGKQVWTASLQSRNRTDGRLLDQLGITRRRPARFDIGRSGCFYPRVLRRGLVMARGKASGYSLSAKDVPTVLGMLARGDRDHDIAGWFGVNQGRIADAKDGKWGLPPMAPATELPPAGPPGIKGRRLRASLGKISVLLDAGLTADAQILIKAALKDYDRNEG